MRFAPGPIGMPPPWPAGRAETNQPEAPLPHLSRSTPEMVEPGRSTSSNGSATLASATFTGSTLAREKPGRRAASVYSPAFRPRNSKRPSGPVSRRTWLPGPTSCICMPPRPARIERAAERLTSQPASGRPSSSFTTPRTERPRRITTLSPERVTPGASEMPPMARSS